MKPLPAVCIVGGLLAAVLTLAQSGGELPANPHAFMDQEGACVSCHKYWEGQLEPHMFSVMIHDVCKACHKDLGRSHPININPQFSELDIPSTGPLPVPYLDELGDDVISCGTCHNPHGEWLSTVRANPAQEEHFLLATGENETPYFKTYYLRISDPDDGYLPLCQTCHYDY